MKYQWLILLAVALATEPAHAQTPKALNPPKAAAATLDSKVYTYVEEMPQPPGGGGNAAIMALIAKELRFPPISVSEQISQSRVVVEFVVTKTSAISQVRVVKSVNKSIDDAVVRAVHALPHLLPGRQQGVPVDVKIIIPVIVCLR